MGDVHFLHGHPHPYNTQTKIEIECPNCERNLEGYVFKDGKKVCPYCEHPLPQDMVAKLG